MPLKKTPQELDALVGRALKSDTDAFAELYDLFVEQIYRYMSFRVDAEHVFDLTETVFLKVWENLHTYKIGQAYFSAWIFRIAHNVVVDHYRFHKTPLELEESVPDQKNEVNPVLMTERALNQEMLTKALSQLKDKYRQVIVLKYINELENHEIAQIMKMTEGNLRILKFRALKALRKILENMGM